MSQPPAAPKPEQTAQQLLTDQKQLLMNTQTLLSRIEKNLVSIRGMLQFFVVLVILGIIIQACTAIMTF
jgi:hypothetical protein